MHPKTFTTIIVSTVGLMLTSCSSKPKQSMNAPDRYHSSLNAYLESTRNHPVSKSDYNVAFTDLNGDGLKDAVALFKRGTEWAGSGGSSLFIFKGTNSGFDFLSKTTVTRAPVHIRKTESNGWNDLVVHSFGGGLPPSDRLLIFDGHRYTPNTSMAPETTILDSDIAVIDNPEPPQEGNLR